MALPAVQNGSRHEGDGRDTPVRAIMPGSRSGWRAGMQQWLSREEVGPSSTRREVHTGRNSAGRNATLTPLRRAEHPRPAAVREYTAGRRSKSAEPGLLLPAEKTREITANSSLASATSSLAALERPMTRTKVQPLVANRADADQVAAFYSELREAEDVGKRRFEGGIEERTLQRLDRQQTKSRLRRMSSHHDETNQPLTHPEFLIAVEKLLHEISRVDDEGYDTDEADEARFKLFDRTRQSWHIARAIPPDYAKSPERQSQTPERQKLRSRGSSRQSQRSTDSSQRSHLRSRGSSRQSESPSKDQEDSDEFTSIEENILHDQARSTRSDGRTSLLRHSTLALQQFASEDLSQSVQHHSAQLAAFATLGIRPDPTCVDLRRRTDAFTSKKLEAVAQLFEHVKGLKSPETLLLSHCQLGAVRLDSMAPHLKRCLTLKRLELNDTNLCSRSSGILAGVLSSLTQLEVLIVDGNPMHARGTKSLMAEARGAESLRGISMKKCQVADEGAHYISQALHPAYWNASHRDELVVERRKSLMQFGLNSHAHGAGHPDFFLGTVLTSLNLSDNMIGPTGSVWLLDSLASFGINLQHLDLSLNFITDAGQDLRGATALGRALKTCTKIVTLNLNDCKLHAEGGHYLVEGLMAKTKELQLEIKVLWSHIGQSSNENKATLEALERRVEQKEKEFRNYIMSRPLNTLLLARNNLGVHGMTILGEARNLFPSLNELDISSNEMTGNSLNFSFDAALVVCSSARSSRHMQVISFRDNRMGIEDPDIPDQHPLKQPALKALCDALSKLSSIVRLDLGKNLIGVMGVYQLAAALDVLKRVAFLDLSSNDLGSNGVKIIVAAFRPALEELILADNNIGPDGTGALATKVPSLTKLTKLDLSGNRLTQALTAKKHTGELGAKAGGFRLKDVAKDLGTFGEARKQLLMAEPRTGGNTAKRGLPALGAACAEHLHRLESMIIYKTIEVGHIRNAKPKLNLSGVDFQPDDITVVFEILAFNKEVTVVDLSWNDLRMRSVAISEWMQAATQLLELNLSNTKIEDQNALTEHIANGLKPLINLTTLNLSNNNIGVDGLQSLSLAIKALTSLKLLDLSCNPVTRRLQNHTSGDNYYSAGVAKLAESLATCEKLQELNLHKCLLGDEGAIEIAECLQYLSGLRSINLVDNYIDAHGQEVLSKAIRKCCALTNADGITAQEIKAGNHLTFNSIYQVSFVATCIRRDAISKIDLSSNNLGCSEETLRDLCEGLVRLQNLTDLNLSGNKPFSRQVSQTLAHSLKPMTSLRSLNLADNAISGDGAAAILCALVNLFQIEVLDLSKNRFTTFPVALSISCPILWKMNLIENPWKYPPPSLMSKNTTQIRDKLNAEFLNGTIDREMALLFIGKTEVGKSSVINALMNEENKAAHIAMDERTHGIQMKIWKPFDSSISPLYNIYDFAGLDLYLPMQFNMCLLRRAIYCIVWRPFRRMRPEERGHSSPGNKAAYVHQETPVYRVGGRGLCTWDDMKPHLGEQVTSFIDKFYRRDTPGFLPGVSILLIATHSDCVDPEDLLRQSQVVKETVEEQVEGLRIKYPYLPPPVLLNSGNPICVSAKTGANVNVLRESLLRETYALPFFGEILPHSWMKARHDVAKIRNLHRAVLRFRKKEADKREKDEREVAQKQPACPLVGTGAPGASSVSSAAPANLLPDSEDGSDAEAFVEEKRRSVAKLWISFAGRCNLRVRIKKMMNITPDMAKGSVWIGHFKNLLQRAGVDPTQTYAAMRYFHDSGWIRCYGFDDNKNSRSRSNEHSAGFEMLDPYRSAGFKLATNSPFVMLRKDAKPPDRPANINEEAWIDMCDTVFIDLQWLFHMSQAFLNHDGTHLVQYHSNPDLQQEAMRFYATGELKWGLGASNLICQLWRDFLHKHEYRRIRHVLESKDIWKLSSQNLIVVPGLRKNQKLAGAPDPMPTYQLHTAEIDSAGPSESVPSSAQQDIDSEVVTQCTVFVSREYSPESVAISQDTNYAHYIVPVLRHIVSRVSCAVFLDCSEYQTDDEMDTALSMSTVLVLCVSDAHMRSKAGLKHILGALNKGLHVIAVILPGYSVWPPSLKNGCWWDFDLNTGAVAQSLSLATLVDLSPGYFRVYFDILMRLQDADADGEIEPHEAEEMWINLRNGEYDEDDPELLDETTVLSASMQLSKDSLLEHRKWVLDSFVQTMESVGRRVKQLYYRKPLFLPELSEEELRYKLITCRTIIKSLEEAMARMDDVKQREEEVHAQVRQAKLAEEESKRLQAEEELRRMKAMADQWHSDPLHAKLAMLKNIANVVPGLQERPRWEQKQKLLDTAQEMALQMRADEQKVLVAQEQASLLETQDGLQDDDRGAAMEDDADVRRQEALDCASEDVDKLDKQLVELAADAARLADGDTAFDTRAHSPDSPERAEQHLQTRSASSEREQGDEIMDPFFHLIGTSQGPGAGPREDVRHSRQRASILAGRVDADPFLGEALMQEPLIGTALRRGLTLGSIQAQAGPLVPPGQALPNLNEEQRKLEAKVQEEKS